jgi:hypothetical protein
MFRSPLLRRTAFLLLASALLLPPLTEARDFREPEEREIAQSLPEALRQVVAQVLVHFKVLWDGEGSSLDPFGSPKPQEGSSLDPFGNTGH